MPEWLDLLRELRGYVPERYQFVVDLLIVLGVGYGLFLASSRGASYVLAWWDRRERRKRLVRSLSDSSVEISGQPAHRFFRPPKVGLLENLEYSYLQLRTSLTGEKFEEMELSNVDGTPETEFLMANFIVGDVRGIRALPGHIRHHVHLELTKRILQESRADAEAIRIADERLSELGQNALSRARFGVNALRQADLTPHVHPGMTYFEKYFQPLMVAFDERFFSKSAGSEPRSTSEILLTHLKHLSNSRVSAARFEDASNCPEFSVVKGVLPQREPESVGRKQDRVQARRFNRKDAALSFLMVCGSNCQEAARRIEYEVGQHLRGIARLGFTYDNWTPLVDENGVPDAPFLCFFWQCDAHRGE